MSNKAKKVLLLIFSVLLVAELGFLGCQAMGGEPDPTIAPTSGTIAPTETATEAPAEVSTEAPTEAPTEPPVLYRNPLNGEPLEEPYTKRIFFITLSNIAGALPHVGEECADIIWEMYIDNYTTRCLAMFSDVTKVEEFGSVRSMRFNFIDLAKAYDAFLAHAGGSDLVYNYAYTSGIDHMNIDTSSATNYSFRHPGRRNQGYSWEHCLFAKGKGLHEKAESKGYRVTQDPNKDYGLNFAEDGTPANGETANLINIMFRLDGGKKLTTMTYDETDGKYVFTQYGKTIDSVTADTRETFENVFVIRTTVRHKEVYHIADLDGSGEGYYACNGKIIPILWHHENDTDPITFTLTDGTPLTQGIGNSYIAIVPTRSEVTYE